MVDHILFQEKKQQLNAETMEEARLSDFFCIKCKLQFGKKLVFDLHSSLVHGEKVEIKMEEKSNFRESEFDEDTSKDHGGKNSYECEICKTCFKRKDNLKKHIDTVHEKKKPFKCEICDYRGSSKHYLKMHVDSVTV